MAEVTLETGLKCLNIGAGATKIKGVETLDVNPEFHTDHCFDIRTVGPNWPIEDESYDEVYLFHTIEHIEKSFHSHILGQIRRILKPNGIFILSFPEFEIIARNWVENERGMRSFWEANIYGLQRTNSDYHLCAMDAEETKDKLLAFGFKDIEIGAEHENEHNTVIRCKKGLEPMKTYEQVVYEDVIAK